jgi:hypothetical protein
MRGEAEQENELFAHLPGQEQECLRSRSEIHTPDSPICHRFTLTNLTTYQQYKLKVGWRRLSDRTSTPERTLNSLVHGDVACKMRKAKGNYLYW